MGTNRQKRIYWLLRTKIVWPIVLILLVVSIISMLFSYNDSQKFNAKVQSDIKSELRSFVELQYVTLKVLEQPLNENLREICEHLRDNEFASTKNIENVDLQKILLELKLDTSLVGLYIINRNGIIINSTVKSDMFLDFSTFGSRHVAYLNDKFKNRKFGAPRFFFDSKAKRYRKYVFMPTNDGKYMIELGAYSNLADNVYSYSEDFFRRKVEEYENLNDISQYMLSTKPKTFDLNKKFPSEHNGYLYSLVKDGEVSVEQEDNEKAVSHSYIYIDYPDDDINRGIIIGIEWNLSGSKNIWAVLFSRQILSLFGLVLLILLFVFFASRKIEKSIRYFADKTANIAEEKDRNYIDVKADMLDRVNLLRRIADNFNKMQLLVKSRDELITEKTAEINVAKRKIIELHELLNVQKQLTNERRGGTEDSVSFSYNLQQAVLQSFGDFEQIFPESFLFMKPRGIVSGDFYWFGKACGKVVVVVADCSGHELNAAFVNVLNIVLMKKLVMSQHIFEPNQILSRLQVEQRELYNGRLNQYYRYCGIDMAVCCIDLETRVLTFAGANARISVVNNGLLQTYNGTHESLGVDLGENHYSFDNNVVPLNQGDSVYMFTNGYSAQFNADDTQKFNNAAFRSLLARISVSPMNEQMTLLSDRLDEWQGKNEQTDDILVLGFKLM